MLKKIINLWLPSLFLFLSISIVFKMHLQALALMPGDLGDARLNNYFLENLYQFFFGNSDSIWDLSFFYPFPYVLGFSDNLFGSAPVYILTRAFGIPSDTAFQFWFLSGYFFNFWACYYSLRRLGMSAFAASIGALVFSFALPTTAHANHAQLQYRFGIPLAIVFFITFLDNKNWKSLIISGAWLTWQFYAGVYMGFFALLLMATMLVTYFGYQKLNVKHSFKSTLIDFIKAWYVIPKNSKYCYFFLLVVLFGLLVLLFFPYLQVSHLYGAQRSWSEIASMLPRAQSYFTSDASALWISTKASNLATLPMHHEHQMFIGLIPMVLALAGFLVGKRTRNGTIFILMSGMTGLAIVLTLSINGFSLWYLLHKLPLFSAIRAVTRLDQALLFPIAYFVAIGIDYLCKRFTGHTILIACLALPLLLIEMAMITMPTSLKETWRQRVAHSDQRVPLKLPKDAVIFIAQDEGPFYAAEIDAMWVALNRGVKTLNGYSGIAPPGFNLEFGKDCLELSNRIWSYFKFSKSPPTVREYQNFISRIIPIGFDNCDVNRWLNVPRISRAEKIYSQDEISHLSYSVMPFNFGRSISTVDVLIRNSADFDFSARSNKGSPLRLSWRFMGPNGIALSGWDERKDLPHDIPKNGELIVPLSVVIPPNAISIQVSLVQEGVFWAHDIGIEPATALLKNNNYSN